MLAATVQMPKMGRSELESYARDHVTPGEPTAASVLGCGHLVLAALVAAVLAAESGACCACQIAGGNILSSSSSNSLLFIWIVV